MAVPFVRTARTISRLYLDRQMFVDPAARVFERAGDRFRSARQPVGTEKFDLLDADRRENDAQIGREEIRLVSAAHIPAMRVDDDHRPVAKLAELALGRRA